MKNEINLMLSSLMKNKRALAKFYKTGYFSYTKDKAFKGATAIVDGNAIVSFLQDANDDSKVIAIASFKNKKATIVQLSGEEFCRTQFGMVSGKLSSSLASIKCDISSVRRHCAEAEEKLRGCSFIRRIFSKPTQSSDIKLSKKDVRFMLENALDKLHDARNLNNRNEVSPKVEITSFATSTTKNSKSLINETIQERQ